MVNKEFRECLVSKLSVCKQIDISGDKQFIEFSKTRNRFQSIHFREKVFLYSESLENIYDENYQRFQSIVVCQSHMLPWIYPSLQENIIKELELNISFGISDDDIPQFIEFFESGLLKSIETFNLVIYFETEEDEDSIQMETPNLSGLVNVENLYLEYDNRLSIEDAHYFDDFQSLRDLSISETQIRLETLVNVIKYSQSIQTIYFYHLIVGNNIQNESYDQVFNALGQSKTILNCTINGGFGSLVCLIRNLNLNTHLKVMVVDEFKFSDKNKAVGLCHFPLMIVSNPYLEKLEINNFTKLYSNWSVVSNLKQISLKPRQEIDPQYLVQIHPHCKTISCQDTSNIAEIIKLNHSSLESISINNRCEIVTSDNFPIVSSLQMNWHIRELSISTFVDISLIVDLIQLNHKPLVKLSFCDALGWNITSVFSALAENKHLEYISIINVNTDSELPITKCTDKFPRETISEFLLSLCNLVNRNHQLNYIRIQVPPHTGEIPMSDIETFRKTIQNNSQFLNHLHLYSPNKHINEILNRYLIDNTPYYN
ncbi:hypothetical protein DLAC_10625 [Tieghemostelium lacteum]|uniref:Uncharacterized protein n=1 Tax=Tieghemostelium lacteum TaxID=361077 RepID=A0A151Z4E3_TIELA|nr:hypothetical protein DLAC_10625 [Tieghemostelium lacteum]|eukprot:KYQ88826.1 hypothetical protein DLAC_10625 [Tieghemostelium lacteum]